MDKHSQTDKLELNPFPELDSIPYKLLEPYHEPSSPQPEDFQCDDLSLDNTLTPSEKERPNDYSEFSPSPVSSTAPTTNMPIAAPKPKGLETEDKPEPNRLQEFASLLSKLQALKPDSCTAPTTNMPIAAPKPSDNQFPVNRENTMRAPITYEDNPKYYMRTCLYALCEPLFMCWKSPISNTGISIKKILTYEGDKFQDNVNECLQALCLPPSSSDGQDNLQSTMYKEKWNEFYNGARSVINELLQSSHTTVKRLQDKKIKTKTALKHHITNTIDPIYSKINKLCELPLYHTQQEALTSSFKAVYKHYGKAGHDSITSIGKAYRKDNPVNNHPVNNFKYCPVIPELKDLFSVEQQDINELENKIKELINYIDQNTHPNNLMVIDNKSMINPRYVTMIKDIIIGEIKQDPEYQCYMPLIKLSVKTNKNQLNEDQDKCLKHTNFYPLVITCQLDESNTLTTHKRDKANTRLDEACRQINEKFTVALDRILSSTSSKKHRNRKKEELKQPEMTPPNRKRKNTLPGLSSETSPSKQQRITPPLHPLPPPK